nr:hypothetical protein [Tanacetum cinerariifolium]GFC70956.1 hypothetical protein [Tanacetum cinerariifolium]
DKRLRDLMMMILVRQIEECDMMLYTVKTDMLMLVAKIKVTEECDLMLYTVKTDMLMLVAEIEVVDKTVDDDDELACSVDVVKSRKVDQNVAHSSI